MLVPTTMKAWIVPHTGGRDVLEFKDIPVPTVAADQVLVKNSYAGLNFIDSYFRSGLYPHPMPHIAGREAAGTVVAIGNSVTKFQVGDRVFWMAGGAFAEYSVISEAGTIGIIPSDIDFKIAAASILQGLTAITQINESYQVKKGDWILLQAAAGGMGLLLAQLMSRIGARVIGTASTDEKAELAKAAGCEFVINYAVEDYVAKVKDLTNGSGVNAVFDGVGKSTFDGSFECLARKGTFVTFGNASGAVPPFSLTRLSAKNIKITRPTLFQAIATPEDLTHYTEMLWNAIRDGGLNIKIFKVYPLADYAAAAEDLEERKSVGKLVLEI
ncbi:hypothetical protein V1512DRAFT_263878 [Lipomyces arxii]|uniref:uncharacterized protein n=1 Tax=Lipomyces arxii TaxID=56418 RepID=UPI0034CEF483